MRIKQAAKLLALVGFVSMTMATTAGSSKLNHLKQRLSENQNLLNAPVEVAKPQEEVKKPLILAQTSEATTAPNGEYYKPKEEKGRQTN